MMDLHDEPSPEHSVTDGMNGSISNLDQNSVALVHEVEHIKELVRLSIAPAQQGISSQIFRRSLQPQVPHTQVLKELDILKLRLKQAGRQAQESPGDSENDAVSDDEIREIQDERLREIASIRAQLEKVKAEREEWMENAENRIDILIAEKADLSEQLQDILQRFEASDTAQAELRNSLQTLVAEKDRALEDLRVAENQVAEFRKDSQRYQELHAEATECLQSLDTTIRETETDKAALQTSLDEAIGKVEHLEDSLSQTSTSLRKAETEMQALESARSETERVLGDKTKEISALREKNHTALEDFKNLEKSLLQTSTSLNEAKVEVQALRSAKSEMQRDWNEKTREITVLRERHHTALEDLKNEFARMQSQTTQNVQTLEVAKAKLEDDLAAVKVSLAKAEKESEAFQASKQHEVDSMEQKISELSASLRRSQSQNDELIQSHEAMTLRLQEQHHGELQKCENEWKSKTAQLESAVVDIKAQLDQSTAQHKNMLLAIKARYEEKSERAQDQNNARIQEERKHYEAELAEAQSAKALMEQALAEEKNINTALETRHAEEIRAIAQASDEALAKSREEAITQTKDAADRETVELKSLHMAELDKIRNELTAKVEEAQKMYKSRSEQLDQYRTDQENNTRISTEKHDVELTALRGEYNAAKSAEAEAKAAVESGLEALKTLEREKIAAEVQLRQQIQDMQEKHDRDLSLADEKMVAAQANFEQQVKAVKNDLLTKSEAVSTAERRLSDMQEKHDRELGLADERMTAAQADFDQQVKAVKADLLTKSDAASTAERRLSELEVAGQRRLKEIEEAHQKASQKSELGHAEAVKEILAEAESKRQEAVQESLLARRNAESELAAATELLQSLRQEHKGKLAAMQQASDTAMSDAIVAHTEEMARLRAELESSKDKAAADAKDKLLAAESQLAQLGSDHEEKLSAMTKTHEEEVSTLNKEFDARLSKMKAAHAQALNALEQDAASSRESAVSDVQQQLDETRGRLTQLEQEHSSRLATVQDEHSEKVAELEKSHSERVSRAERELDETRGRFTQLEQEHSSSLATVQDEHKQKFAELEKTQNERVSRAERELDESRARLAQLEQEQSSKLATVQDEHNQRIAELEKLNNETVSRAERESGETQARLTQLEQEHSSSLASIQVQHNQKLAELEKTHNEMVSRAERDLADAKVRHAQEMDNLREGAEIAKSKAVGSVQEKLQAIVVRLAELEKTHAKELSEAQAETGRRVTEEQRKHAEALDKYTEDAETAKDKAVTSVQSRLQEALARLEKDHEADLARHSEQNDAQIRELTQQHMAKLSEMQAEQEKNIANAQSDMKATISRDMEAKIEAIVQQHREELKAHDNDADVRLAQLKETHVKELSELHETAQALKAEAAGAVERAEIQAKQGVEAIAQLEQTHSQNLTNIQDEAEARIIALQDEHRQAMTEASKVAELDKQQTIKNYDRLLGQARRSSIKSIEDLRHHHNEELAVLRADRTSEHSPAVRELQEILQEQLQELEVRLTETEEREERHQKSVFPQEPAKVQRSLEEMWEGDRVMPVKTWFHARDAEQAIALGMSPGHIEKVEIPRAVGNTQAEESLGEVEEVQKSHAIELEGAVRKHRPIPSETQNSHEQQVALLATIQEPDRQHTAHFDPAPANVRFQAAKTVADQLQALATQLDESNMQIHNSDEPCDDDTAQLEELIAELLEFHIGLGDSKQQMVTPDYADLRRKLTKLMERRLDHRGSMHSPREALSMDHTMSQGNKYLVTTEEASQDSDPRSFEAYLQQAQSELWELGKVISHNESMFAAKIAQHIGGIQRAKDELAREYKNKFDSLVVQQREKPRDSVDAPHGLVIDAARGEPTSLRHSKDMPGSEVQKVINIPETPGLQEGKLREAANKRSQTFLSHASEFQVLNTKYERRLAELSGNKENLEVDLSVEPGHFEELASELDAISEQLSSTRFESVSGSPGSPGVSLPLSSPMSEQMSPLNFKSMSSSPRTLESSSHLSSPVSIRRKPGLGNLRSRRPSNDTDDHQASRRGQTQKASATRNESQNRDDVTRTRYQRTPPTKAHSQWRDEHVPDSHRLTSPRGTSAKVGAPRPLTPLSEVNVSDSSDGPIARRRVERPRTSERWASRADAERTESVDVGFDAQAFEHKDSE